MALRHENSGKENASTRGGSVTEIGSARESDLGKLCKLNGLREIHGVDRLVECQAIQTRTVVTHVRMLVEKNESGRDTASVWRWRNGKGRCR